MSEGIKRFFNSINKAKDLKTQDLIGLFVYYITIEKGEDAATARKVSDCFLSCELSPPSRTAQYLSERARPGRFQEFIKVKKGYKLQHYHREKLSAFLGAESIVVPVSAELRRLEDQLNEGTQKEFLKEVIDCFEAGANRATVVMCWILAISHLYNIVIKNHLVAFNESLAKQTDKKVKTLTILSRDDLSEISEAKFIELLRASKIITNDVRKLLDEKLGIRNSCAHPSGIVIKRSKVISYVEDLMENIILKYQV